MLLKSNLRVKRWTSIGGRQWLFPRLGETAQGMLIPFAKTYLCDSRFSTLLSIKKKSKNNLKAQADMRVAISNICRSTFSKSHKQEQEQTIQ